jgi:hypothetical protein
VDDADALTRAWRETQANLPGGWTLDSLRCASTGILPDQWSGEWIAVAVRPGGARQTHGRPIPSRP